MTGPSAPAPRGEGIKGGGVGFGPRLAALGESEGQWEASPPRLSSSVAGARGEASRRGQSRHASERLKALSCGQRLSSDGTGFIKVLRHELRRNVAVKGPGVSIIGGWGPYFLLTLRRECFSHKEFLDRFVSAYSVLPIGHVISCFSFPLFPSYS